MYWAEYDTDFVLQKVWVKFVGGHARAEADDPAKEL
jgi:hypothetical protein